MNTRAVPSKVGALGSVVAAALVPKCPLCVAAMLATLGIGGGIAAAVAPYLRFAVIAVAVCLTAFVLLRGRRRRCER